MSEALTSFVNFPAVVLTPNHSPAPSYGNGRPRQVGLRAPRMPMDYAYGNGRSCRPSCPYYAYGNSHPLVLAFLFPLCLWAAPSCGPSCSSYDYGNTKKGHTSTRIPPEGPRPPKWQAVQCKLLRPNAVLAGGAGVRATDTISLLGAATGPKARNITWLFWGSGCTIANDIVWHGVGSFVDGTHRYLGALGELFLGTKFVRNRCLLRMVSETHRHPQVPTLCAGYHLVITKSQKLCGGYNLVIPRSQSCVLTIICWLAQQSVGTLRMLTFCSGMFLTWLIHMF